MSDERSAGIFVLDEFGLHDARGIGGEDFYAWLDRKERERAMPVVDPTRVVQGKDFKLSYDASDAVERERIRELVRDYEGFEEWEPEVVRA